METERVTVSKTIEAAPEAVFAVREHLQFPPFGLDHLDNSLQHLSELVAGNSAP